MIYSITSAFILQIYKSDKFELVHLYEAQPLNVEIDLRYFTEPDFIQERAASILEQKYEAENSIFEAVVCGDCRSALEGYQQYSSFNETNPIGRTLRQCQNDLIAFNTLLRKAIERANVHPYYIDTINNKYLKKIDEAQDQSKCAQISHDMIMDYCAYVHRYSLKQYSPLVQKVINYVNMHLDLPLSLKILSEMYFISPSYLSWLFKQETGTTLTDYINVQRMQRAAVSLVATNNSISTIAAEVGMMDVNYFSKIFKKNHGVTPTQYRRENQKAN
jgi:YesN/AraC family two-component response regulator